MKIFINRQLELSLYFLDIRKYCSFYRNLFGRRRIKYSDSLVRRFRLGRNLGLERLKLGRRIDWLESFWCRDRIKIRWISRGTSNRNRKRICGFCFEYFGFGSCCRSCKHRAGLLSSFSEDWKGGLWQQLLLIRSYLYFLIRKFKKKLINKKLFVIYIVNLTPIFENSCLI